MDVYPNITAMGPGSDPMALLAAIQKNNAASSARQAGRYDEAIALYKEALEDKIRAHGEESIHAALSFNSLGETYLEVGKLDEAEQCFKKALKVRDDVAFGGQEVGPRNDAAATRDNMARVLEARGDFEGARAIRIKGADKGHTMCGCEDVSATAVFSEEKRKENVVMRGYANLYMRHPSVVLDPWRSHALTAAVENVWSVSLRLLLQLCLPKEGLGIETQAAVQEVHEHKGFHCQHCLNQCSGSA